MMKTSLAVLIFAAVASSALAQNMHLDWFTIDGGGGTSSRGAYSLSGTIGQPEASVASAGAVRLEGGFWPAFADDVLTNETYLRIRLAPTGDALVSWSALYADYLLEGANDLPTTNWFQFPMPPTLNGTEVNMLVPINQPHRYFRLRKP